MDAICYGAPLPVSEFKAVGDAWEVSGYASTYGNRDLGGDVVMRGAFDEWLAGWRTGQKKTRFLFAHNPSMILGKLAEMKSDDRGLFIRGKISKTQLGSDVHTLLKDDALDSFSIGYVPVDVEYDDDGTRKVTAIDLYECSLVAVPMNDQAVVTGVKAPFCAGCGQLLNAPRPITKQALDLAKLTFSELAEHFTQVADRFGMSAKSLLATLTGEGHALNDNKRQELEQLLGTFPGLDAVRSDVQQLLQTTRESDEPPLEKQMSATRLHLDLVRRRLRHAGVDV